MPFHLTKIDFDHVITRYNKRGQPLAPRNILIAEQVIVYRERPTDVAKAFETNHQRVSELVKKVKAIADVDDWRTRVDRILRAAIEDPEMPKEVRSTLIKSVKPLGFLKGAR